MLRCLLQRATHLPNLEKGDKQSDPVASLTFRGEGTPNLGWGGWGMISASPDSCLSFATSFSKARLLWGIWLEAGLC